jgi:choline dehydrogenase-like flavoprotein
MIMKDGVNKKIVLSSAIGTAALAAGYYYLRDEFVRSGTFSDLRKIADTQMFDVCIIGSGFAGTILGTLLVESGARTVILESGKNLANWMLDSRINELASYQTTGNTNYPEAKTRARAFGGNSNFWTGRCDRLHPSDFEANPYTPDGSSWPFSYSEFEPYYEKAEKILRVRGGNLSEYSPPRRINFPLPPKPDISALKAMMAEYGVTIDDSPTATPTRGLRFFRVSKEILPRYLNSSSGTLISGATVTRLISDDERRIVAAEVRSLDGGKTTVNARLFVLACGGIENPRLLLLSRSELLPNGIGNSYDRVGRGFNEHAGVNFYARIPHRWSTIYPRHKLGRSHQYYDLYRKENLGSILPVFTQSWVFPHHLREFRIAELPMKTFSMLSRLKRAQIYIGSTIEMLPDDSNRVMLSKNMKDCFGDPIPHLHFSYTDQDIKTLNVARSLIRGIFKKMNAQDIREVEVTWSRHHIGTNRIGNNPKTSVTDQTLRVHDTPNLYLCGSDVFVTGGAVPPVLTITALTFRLADHLITRLESG